MVEKNNGVLKSINELIEKCRMGCAVTEFEREIKFLILDLVGEDSKEFCEFKQISNFYLFGKRNAYIGLLNSLKNHVLIFGLPKTKEENIQKPLLHPRLAKVCMELFEHEHYVQAVEVGIKEICSRLKNIYKKHRGVDLDEVNLFSMVFNSDENKTLFVAGENLKSISGKDEQDGFRMLFLGMWKALRNPNAHNNRVMTINEARDQLYFLSMLMYKIDVCLIKSNLSE